MTTTVYYVAASLDGFIADAEHSLEWLFGHEQEESGPLTYEAFLARIGAVVMGSTTYEWLLEQLAGPWPYDLPCWVLTTRDLPTVDGDVRFARGDVRPIHRQMAAAADGRDLWIVGGGELAGRFVDAGLLDELVVTIAPVTLGQGAPLLPRRLDLRLVELARNGAFVHTRYAVVGPGPVRAPSTAGGAGD